MTASIRAVAHSFSGHDLGAGSAHRHLASGVLDPLSRMHLDGHVDAGPRDHDLVEVVIPRPGVHVSIEMHPGQRIEHP